MSKIILHSDLNGFYASVECFTNPKIRRFPVVVGGDSDARHGIVLAKNEIAKIAGIVTGETLYNAKIKCPNLVTVPPDFSKYLKFSRLTKQIYERFTDQVESFGIDECWLDVTASTKLFGTGEVIANEIRNTIKKEIGITASVGVSFNKIYAKLASDMKKPDATTIITKDNYKELVWKLPASDLLYVGKATKKKLQNLKIFTIGQLANTDINLLINHLGSWGYVMHTFANGKDNTPVKLKGEESFVKSVGNQMTLHRDIETLADVKRVFYLLSESVATRLREHGLKANVVQISIRDNNFTSVQRQGRLGYPTFLTADIANKALEIFTKKHNFSNPIRSLGMRASNLEAMNSPLQLDFFTDHVKRRKTEILELTIDDIRRRYGYDIVHWGIMREDHLLTSGNPAQDHIIHPINFFSGKIVSEYDLKQQVLEV